jgi:hypothetical protein
MAKGERRPNKAEENQRSIISISLVMTQNAARNMTIQQKNALR